jgi:hypothetical protein
MAGALRPKPFVPQRKRLEHGPSGNRIKEWSRGVPMVLIRFHISSRGEALHPFSPDKSPRHQEKRVLFRLLIDPRTMWAFK